MNSPWRSRDHLDEVARSREGGVLARLGLAHHLREGVETADARIASWTAWCVGTVKTARRASKPDPRRTAGAGGRPERVDAAELIRGLPGWRGRATCSRPIVTGTPRDDEATSACSTVGNRAVFNWRGVLAQAAHRMRATMPDGGAGPARAPRRCAVHLRQDGKRPRTQRAGCASSPGRRSPDRPDRRRSQGVLAAWATRHEGRL